MVELKPKQIQITECIAQGMRNKEIAVVVGTTEDTVKNYLRDIYDITGMDTRLELALWYLAHKQDVVVKECKHTS